MIDHIGKQVALQRILTSDSFSNSSVSQNLLSYLCDATIAGNPPKELDIAIAVFGKDDRFDPAHDNIVRANIYTLRKKLRAYYDSDGKNDTLLLSIPKGHYEVCFEEKCSRRLPLKGVTRPAIAYTGATFLMLLLISGNLYQWANEGSVSTEVNESSSHPFWSLLGDHERRTRVVLGDEFYFRATATEELSRPHFVMNQEINSREAYNRYIQAHPELEGHFLPATESLVSYLPDYTAFALFELIPLLGSDYPNLDLVLGSKLTWSDFQKDNIIFVGNYWSLNILQHFFSFTKLKFHEKPRGVYLTNTAGDTTLYPSVFIPSAYPHEQDGYPPKRWFVKNDYTLVTRIPGPGGNTILIISAFMGASIREGLRFLKAAENLAKIDELCLQQYGRIPEYFEMLLEIEGIDGLGYTANILHLFEIDPNYHLRGLTLSQGSRDVRFGGVN
jgi:hypothetical protein